MTAEDEVRINAYIPAILKERLKQGDTTMKDELVEALEIYYSEGGDSRAAIERQKKRLQEKKARGERLIEDGEAMVDEAEESLERLNEKLDLLNEQSESYEDALEDALNDLQEYSMSIFVGHGKLQQLAADHGKTQKQVLADLRERGDLHESYFTEGAPEPEPDEDVPGFLRGDS